MYLPNSCAWKSIGVSIIVLILLQACSGADLGSDALPKDDELTKSCQEDMAYFEQFVNDNYTSVKVSDGGKLYDMWWAALNTNGPTNDHPLWALRAKDGNGVSFNARSGEDSWRCKECHSWDYKGKDGIYSNSSSHFTDFPGITVNINDSNTDLFCKIRDGMGINPNHQFNAKNTGGALTDLAVLALTRFVREGQVEVNNFIDSTTKLGMGDIGFGQQVYTTPKPISCSNGSCHGTDGTANFNISLKSLALDNPWEVLHKIRFGHPGSSPTMPSFSDYISETDIKNVLSYVQVLEPTCIKENAALIDTQLSSSVPWDGGQVYDQWWNGTSIPAPTSSHPLWANQTSNQRSGADTWRCKECHGWDYKGKDGAYNASSDHYTGFSGIKAAENKSAVDVFCAIADGTNVDKQHNFLKTNQNPVGLTQAQILQLTRFITASGTATNDNGLVDANEYIATSGQGRGDVTNGQLIFSSNPLPCQSCHGVDGTFGFEAGVSLGALASENPWEVLHKIRYGHPNSIMPGYIEDGASFEMTDQEIKDVLSYAQTLNGGTPPLQACSTELAAFVDAGYASAKATDGGRLYDNWIAQLGVAAPAADHPMWSGRAVKADGTFANSRSGADSWRCKECHGWDYNGKDGAYNLASSHYTGFTGLFAAVNKTPIEVFCAIRDGEGIDPAHGFTPVMTANKLSNNNILSLTKFILDPDQMGMIDTTAYIPVTGIVTGDVVAGQTVFTTTAGCAQSACHGINGDTNAGGISIGQIAFENPWEVLHKIRNGHAALDSPMPSFVNSLNSTQVQNVLAYAQNSLPRSTGGTTACRDEMTTRGIDTLLTTINPWDGGQLYDKWWAINDTPPANDHPLWALQNFNSRTGSETWRCKECHGWDYKGDAGAYDANSSHYTGFTGILASANKSAADIFCAIRDGEGINVGHQFNIGNTNGLMTEYRLFQLTKFITAGGDAGMLDSAIFVDSAGVALGDAVLGNDIYFSKAQCSNCHGATGLTNVPVGVTLGDLANQNPWEVIHKIRFGNPGQFMPIYTQDGLAAELTNNEIKNVLAFVQTLPQTAVAGSPTTQATCAVDKLDFVNTNIDTQLASQGGALYDKWWVALGYGNNEGPPQDNPLWANADSTNQSAGSDTWRCKECHGWDYKGKDGAYGTGSSHYTGFPGIFAARGKQPIDLFCAISQGTTAFPEHKFNPQNSQLTDQAILQLTKFILDNTNGVIDMNTYIDPLSKTPINANATLGLQEFSRCSICHGVDGTLNAGGSTIGALAIDNPWEVLHKIRNGNPGSAPSMPAFVNSDLNVAGMIGIIAHLQTLPTTGGQIPPPVTSEVEMLVRGGLLYDDWMATVSVAAPASDNPVWVYQNTNNRTGADTWRCKECHGWDYKGRDGQYGPGSSHFTGFVGIWGIANDASVSEQAIFNTIKSGALDILGNTIHDFGPLLTDPDIQALAKFIKQGLVDTDMYISPITGIANGSVTNGEIQFIDTGDIATVNNANCSFCHGLDGTAINFGTVTTPESLGALSRSNPWEVLHKARFGQPASVMPSAELKGLALSTVVDVISYAQTLPDATTPPVVTPPVVDD